jgi:hypothetical protein
MSGLDELITNIEKSQTDEQKLIEQLNTLTNQSDYTINSNVTSLIESINNLSDSRISMFKTISNNADILQAGVSNSRTDLISQMTLLGVVEDQLNKAKSSMEKLQNRNDTKMRLVQINTYYGQRYSAQSKLMKMIILICIPLLVLFILKKKELIPELISNYAIGITIAVGAIFVIRAVWDISTRNNMNFDEYDWKYEDPKSQVPTKWQYNKEHLFNFDNPIKTLVGNLGLCVGSDCCANGMYFDTSKQQCSTSVPLSTSTTESFACGAKLNGTTIANIDNDEDKQNGISPFSYTYDFAKV